MVNYKHNNKVLYNNAALQIDLKIYFLFFSVIIINNKPYVKANNAVFIPYPAFLNCINNYLYILLKSKYKYFNRFVKHKKLTKYPLKKQLKV